MKQFEVMRKNEEAAVPVVMKFSDGKRGRRRPKKRWINGIISGDLMTFWVGLICFPYTNYL